jgi:anti-sigma B factor antagonist
MTDERPLKDRTMAHTGSNPRSVIREVRQDDSKVIIALAGDVDLHSSIELRQHLLGVLEKKPPIIVLNLEGVDFMDSSGLATLVEALQLSRRSGGQIRLAALKQRVKNLLEISRLDAIFKIYASEAEALA